MLNDRRHTHVVPPTSQPFPPKPGEPMVSWMTNSGLIAIPESEAKMRREGMANQLGFDELVQNNHELRDMVNNYALFVRNAVDKFEDFEAQLEVAKQEIQMLKNFLGRLIDANDLVQTPR